MRNIEIDCIEFVFAISNGSLAKQSDKFGKDDMKIAFSIFSWILTLCKIAIAFCSTGSGTFEFESIAVFVRVQHFLLS